MIVQPDVPRQIIADGDLYRLIAEESVVRPQSIEDVDRLQEAAICILRKYVDAFYRVRRERWESGRMIYKPLDERDPNLSFSREPEAKGQYVVSIRQSEHTLISEIEKLIDEGERLYAEEQRNCPAFTLTAISISLC